VLNNFLKDFQEDEKALHDYGESGVPAEKQRDIEKREKEEVKRLEKQVFKKDQVEVEEASRLETAYGNWNACPSRSQSSRRPSTPVMSM
jgi:hypothetical protein